MAVLKEIGKNHFCYLLPHHSFGRRADVVDTVLEHEEVSKIHAVIEWTGNCWLIKDMSRNGLWFNGERLAKLTPVMLTEGATLAFDQEATLKWTIINLDAPQNLLLTLPPSQKYISVHDYLLLPDNEQPQWVIFRSQAQGEWMCRPVDDALVDDAGGVVLRHMELVKIGDRFWQAFFPPALELTKDRSAQTSIKDFVFYFDVSLDEENIGLTLRDSISQVELGQRVNFYLLLYLARKRVADMQMALPEKEQGWVKTDIATRELGLDDSHLNIQIYRVRQQFSTYLPDVDNLDCIIQRRRGSVRFGIEGNCIQINKS